VELLTTRWNITFYIPLHVVTVVQRPAMLLRVEIVNHQFSYLMLTSI